MGFFDSISSLNNDLGKFTHEHWSLYLIITIAVAAGGLLAAFFSWAFAIIVPLFILFIGYAAKTRYEKNNP
jgi:hypothetical protein